MSIIFVSINDQNHEIDAGSNLEELLLREDICSDGIATAVNNIFVPKSERSNHIMQNKDSVIIFSAITGG